MMSYDYPHPVSRTYQYKKITKPLLERKRRARINRCLDELKDLMVDALETEGESISKLEKADILELTVRHLQRLQASRPSGLSTVAIPGEDSSESRWRSGFGHCAAEACRFLTALPGEAADRLARHLATGLQAPRQLEVQVSSQKSSISSPPLSPTNGRSGMVSPILASLEKTANKLSAPSISPAGSSAASSSSPPPLPTSRQNSTSPRATSHPYSTAKIIGVNDRPTSATSCSSVGSEEAKNFVRSMNSSVGKEAPSELNDPETDGGVATLLVLLSPRPVQPTRDAKIGGTKTTAQQIIADDEEEIDVENIDEGDPMWRPW